jgi:hypothetical protein
MLRLDTPPARMLAAPLVIALLLGGLALPARLVAQPAQVRPAKVDISDLVSACVDRGFRGGACADYQQFAEIDGESMRYFHEPSLGNWNEKCTASFVGLPAAYTITYRQEDGVLRDGSGEARLDRVCYLLAVMTP